MKREGFFFFLTNARYAFSRLSHISTYPYLSRNTVEHHGPFDTQPLASNFSASAGNIDFEHFDDYFFAGVPGPAALSGDDLQFRGPDDNFHSFGYYSTSHAIEGIDEFSLSSTEYPSIIGNQEFNGLNEFSLVPTGASEMESGPSNPVVDQASTQFTDQSTLNNGFGVIPTTTETIMNGNRFMCSHPGCNKTFSRIGDRRRHLEKQHGPPQHSCSSRNCNKKGLNGFRRPDKLRDHQRKVHGMAV